MTLSKTLRLWLASFLAVFALVGAPLAATAEGQPTQAPRVVTYDSSQAAEFKAVVDQAAKVWNDNVHNVRLEPANGGQADVTILADDGWPRAEPTELGKGTVYIGREAVNQGYDQLRISTHELGHIYGLPDHRVPNCDELMSGHSAGPECKNPKPNGDEIKTVDDNFAAGVAVARQLITDDAHR